MSDLRTLLTDIYEKHGKLDGETVVAVATDPAHPLHSHFEWDDTIAARQHRITQGNTLIRKVTIQTLPPTADQGPHYVRAFVSNKQSGAPDRNGYSPLDEIVADPQRYKMLLSAFQRQINDLERRYGHLEEYSDLMAKAAGRNHESAVG